MFSDDPHHYGPHWEPGLIGPHGRLMKLCKGAKAPKVLAPPPPVRESAPEAQQAKEDQRLQENKRKGYQQSLLSPGGMPQQPGKSLLG